MSKSCHPWLKSKIKKTSCIKSFAKTVKAHTFDFAMSIYWIGRLITLTRTITLIFLGNSSYTKLWTTSHDSQNSIYMYNYLLILQKCVQVRHLTSTNVTNDNVDNKEFTCWSFHFWIWIHIFYEFYKLTFYRMAFYLLTYLLIFAFKYSLTTVLCL